jgi:hypothetical protein
VLRLPGGETVDRATGEVIAQHPSPVARDGEDGTSVESLFDELRESLDARSERGGEL